MKNIWSTVIQKKKIQTLITDIQDLLVSGTEVSDELIQKFSTNLAVSIKESLALRNKQPTLRMSSIGQPCERKLWYEINSPELAEPIRPETYLKFIYGHLTEELLLFLAEAAGHEVSGRQDEQDIAGIKGHRDAVINGHLVDVKSASSYSFKKFENGTLKDDDAFGYSTQLQSYLYASQDDPVVTDKDSASFFVIDKTLGHIVLDTHAKEDKDYTEVFSQKREMVNVSEPPARPFEDVPMGESGNRKLGTVCSYCPFKQDCWPGLRTFIYSYGPVYLTRVHRLPNVTEI